MPAGPARSTLAGSPSMCSDPNSQSRKGEPHGALREGPRPHSLPGGRLRLPPVRHPRRRPELDHRLHVGPGAVQRDRGIQGRVPLYHGRPAQRAERPVFRATRDRPTVGLLCRRPPRPHGSPGHPAFHGDRLLHRRPVHLEAGSARAGAHRRRGRVAARRLPPGIEPHVRQQHADLGARAGQAAARPHDGHDRQVPDPDVRHQRRLRVQRVPRRRQGLPGARARHAGRDAVAPLRARHRVGDAGPEVRADLLPVEGHEGEDPTRSAPRAHVPQGEPAGLISMPASKYVRPTVWVPPAISAVLQPQPPLAPSIPPVHVVDLMTDEGSAASGARWRVKEAKVVECPALTNSLPEFKTTYDIEPHAELSGFDDSDWAVIPPADLGVRRGGGLVSFIWFRTTLTMPANVAGVDSAGAKAVFRVNVDDYAEVWINGTMLRTPGRPSPGAIQGFNMPNRVVLADGAVSAGEKFEIAVFAINGPISAAPGNFLFFREAKVEFFR